MQIKGNVGMPDKMHYIEEGSPEKVRVMDIKKKKRRRCDKCGNCCIAYEGVVLTVKDRHRKFRMQKRRTFKDEHFTGERVARKRAYIKELGRTVTVCYYLDVKARLCLIHKRRPESCRLHICFEKNHSVGTWFTRFKTMPAAKSVSLVR